jgi:hypothetical protein
VETVVTIPVGPSHQLLPHQRLSQHAILILIALTQYSRSSSCAQLVELEITELHRNITEEEVLTSSDGYVSFQEFKRWMEKTFYLVRGSLMPSTD